MTGEMVTWLLAIPMLGFATGLRTMTPIAVLCWYGWSGELSIHHDWAFWATKLVTAIVFTVLAVGELVADKLPGIPARVSLFPLLARLVFGGLCGAIAASSLKGPGIEGGILGVIGALIGAFVGFMVRRDLATKGCPDWNVALGEDAIAIALAITAVHIIAG
jgi:uncharacterized membrane protein